MPPLVSLFCFQPHKSLGTRPYTSLGAESLVLPAIHIALHEYFVSMWGYQLGPVIQTTSCQWLMILVINGVVCRV